ncbi:hypothetical protein J1614_000743 [Plenodomus biglobosus]|nr:hypothetical protein J1614_000743 [Plenodomus biglobosus]
MSQTGVSFHGILFLGLQPHAHSVHCKIDRWWWSIQLLRLGMEATQHGRGELGKTGSTRLPAPTAVGFASSGAGPVDPRIN